MNASLADVEDSWDDGTGPDSGFELLILLFVFVWPIGKRAYVRILVFAVLVRIWYFNYLLSYRFFNGVQYLYECF